MTQQRLTMTAIQSKASTAQEYLALEMESQIRSEYRNGVIVPMTGGTPDHNAIAIIFNALLWLGLKGKPYRIFGSDQRLWIPKRNLYTYPDGMVLPNPIELQPGRKDTVMNPLLIAEVLSTSTKDYDRNEKFAAYQTISTVQEYLLIDQYQPRVEQYVRQESNEWWLKKYSGKDAQMILSSVPVKIALSDLYENVEF
jgi:Uma2 family endonuclease